MLLESFNSAVQHALAHVRTPIKSKLLQRGLGLTKTILQLPLLLLALKHPKSVNKYTMRLRDIGTAMNEKSNDFKVAMKLSHEFLCYVIEL